MSLACPICGHARINHYDGRIGCIICNCRQGGAS